MLFGLAVVLVPTSITLVMAYQRRWLDDDGFINLRIARNLLDGHGPVFNLDERVEAGTSPLWLALVSLLGALGVRLEDSSVFTGIALTVLAVLVAQDGAGRLYAPTGSSLHTRLGLRWLPLGALTIAVLPPIWDYASSGLETGLSLCWLACAYDVLVLRLTRAELEPPQDGAAQTEQALPRQLASALLLGLGILIRPELTLYALGFFALYVGIVVHTLGARGASGGARKLVRVAWLSAAFVALPVLYQLFRMGYYGALSPNTALAKEAFQENWEQGRCYLQNFVGTYRLKLPLLTLSLLLGWLMRGRVAALRARAEGARTWTPASFGHALWLGVLLAPPALGLVHALYVVRMGGDYMHARMFLPATFAALLPVAVVPAWLQPAASASQGAVLRRASEPLGERSARVHNVLLLACSAVVLGWCVLCARSLRVPVENQCGIGDERGWYARMAEVPNPVHLEDYEKHPFHVWGRDLVEAVRKTCPELDTAREGSDKAGCRLTHLTPEEAREVSPPKLSYPLAHGVDPRLLGQISQGAMGIAGMLLPDNVHLFDVHGLADPFVSRAQLKTRGRPGHEKTLPVAWRLARFAAPSPEDDADIAAARRALGCGALATLDRAARAPLSLGQFLSNLAHAPEHTRMRIPREPFEAEASFCGSPRWSLFVTPGEGGDAFHWRCPEALGLTGLRGAFSTQAGALSRVVASCSEPAGSTQPPLLGPAFGPDADAPFALVCPEGSRAVGIYGHADKVVHALGLVCSSQAELPEARPAEPTKNGHQPRVLLRTHSVGKAVGTPFEFVCPRGRSARSLRGRAGALLDALGLGCQTDLAVKAR